MLPRDTFVVIGPESTGKTSLCQQLAWHFQCNWIPEYARTYLEKENKKYSYKDVIHIARKQIELEEKTHTTNSFLFIDTDLIITKVWLLHVYKKCPLWIEQYIKKAYRKAYLITFPDIAWEPDPLRENPHIREYLFNWYVEEVKKINIPYFIVKGKGIDRFNNALTFIKSIHEK